MSEAKSVGRLELQVLEQLWELGEATVTEVHESLSASRRLAPTTVSTILRRLEAKGLATHRKDARRYVFRATVERRELRRNMLGDVVERLFGGSTDALMSHLVDEGHVDRRQLDRLRREIDRRTQPRRPR